MYFEDSTAQYIFIIEGLINARIDFQSKYIAPMLTCLSFTIDFQSFSFVMSAK